MLCGPQELCWDQVDWVVNDDVGLIVEVIINVGISALVAIGVDIGGRDVDNVDLIVEVINRVGVSDIEIEVVGKGLKVVINVCVSEVVEINVDVWGLRVVDNVGLTVEVVIKVDKGCPNVEVVDDVVVKVDKGCW